MRVVWEWGMTTALAVLLGRKQVFFLTDWVEGNISTIKSLAFPEVKKKAHYFHNFSQPRGTQGHHEKDASWCFLICECTFSKTAAGSATWAECRGSRKFQDFIEHRLQTLAPYHSVE